MHFVDEAVEAHELKEECGELFLGLPREEAVQLSLVEAWTCTLVGACSPVELGAALLQSVLILAALPARPVDTTISTTASRDPCARASVVWFEASLPHFLT